MTWLAWLLTLYLVPATALLLVGVWADSKELPEDQLPLWQVFLYPLAWPVLLVLLAIWAATD